MSLLIGKTVFLERLKKVGTILDKVSIPFALANKKDYIPIDSYIIQFLNGKIDVIKPTSITREAYLSDKEDIIDEKFINEELLERFRKFFPDSVIRIVPFHSWYNKENPREFDNITRNDNSKLLPNPEYLIFRGGGEPIGIEFTKEKVMNHFKWGKDPEFIFLYKLTRNGIENTEKTKILGAVGANGYYVSLVSLPTVNEE
jgi:hypothetical protein